MVVYVSVCSWQYLSHTDAVYCAYESGDDGLLGVCDDRGQLCLALALWNGKDHILKERLFGLSGPQVSTFAYSPVVEQNKTRIYHVVAPE